MALTNVDHDFIAEVLSSESIQEQANVGNITQDDADLAISIQGQTGNGGMLDDFVGGTASVIQHIETRVVDELPNGDGGIGGLPFDLEDKIKGWIESAIGPIIDFLSDVDDRIRDSIEDASDAILGEVRDFGLDIVTTVANTTSLVLNVVDGLEQKILEPIGEALQQAQDAFEQIDDKVRGVVSDLVTPIKMVADAVLDQVTGFATALREALPELGLSLVEGFANPLGAIADGAGDIAKTLISNFFEDLAPDLVVRIEPLIKMFEDELDVNPELRAITAPGILPVAAVGGLIAGFALPMILSSVASTALSPFAEKMRQRMNSLVRPTLMTAQEIISAEQKGFVPDQLRDLVLSRIGFPGDQQAALLELVKLRPGTFDIIDYWRRELLTDVEADTELHMLGWDTNYRDLLRQAAFPPPGVQDLIRMAVREVFSPEVAEAFGQFEEIPEPYLMWAKRIGLSEEWARNYWAAHWVLPSVQQGFEMLHRSVISSDDLERLFVALDVMPFWRQPLKDISFRPYTRVDVRRMFALDILDRAGVLRAYLDLGFDPEKAENMAEFTVRFVDAGRKTEKERERDLTKGDIIGLFNDGLLNGDTARTQLESMGFDANEADLLISREELQELRSDRKADIRVIVDQAKIKTLTFQEANDRLNALDLTRRELEKAVVDITRATEERIRLPTKGDLDSWKALDLISATQYETELDNLGFPSRYVALYVEESQLETAEDLLAAEERAARAAEPRSITKGQLDSLLRTEIIDNEAYIEGLVTLGFNEQAISRFVEAITIQIEETRLADLERLERGESAADKEKLLSRVILGKLVIQEIIDIVAYREGLTQLGFSIESVNLLVQLLETKLAASEE